MKENKTISVELKNLIVKYLTNEIQEEELSVLYDWLNENDNHREIFNKIRTVWLTSGKKTLQENTDRYKAWDRFWNKHSNRLKSGIFFFKYRKHIAIAASWLIFMFVGSMVPLDNWFVSRNPTLSNISLTEIVAPLGAKCKVTLPDKTIVWLNAGSKISYDKSFNLKERLVQLEGEAYFSVAENKTCPFEVKTSDILITALGTKFNVKAYPEEETITATLEEGKINVVPIHAKKSTEPIILKPNENIVYYKHDNSLKLDNADGQYPKGDKNVKNIAVPSKIKIASDVNTELYTSWKEERWIFLGEPLPSLASKLERRFNMHIVFADDQLKDYKFSGSIENETVEQILQALRLTAPLKFKIVKNTIILSVDHQLLIKYDKIIKPKE